MWRRSRLCRRHHIGGNRWRKMRVESRGGIRDSGVGYRVQGARYRVQGSSHSILWCFEVMGVCVYGNFDIRLQNRTSTVCRVLNLLLRQVINVRVVIKHKIRYGSLPKFLIQHRIDLCQNRPVERIILTFHNTVKRKELFVSNGIVRVSGRDFFANCIEHDSRIGIGIT